MTVDLSTLEAITRLAEQFGPFLFAVLFIMVVTRTARGYYVECMTRRHPPPSDQEQKTYRLYFVSSVCVGIMVMTLSIGWWFYVQAKGNHVYQVAIIGLKADETVLADYYFKQVQRPTVAGGRVEHDTYFLIVRDNPFKVGERFAFEYFKIPTDLTAGATGITGQPVEIKYAGNGSNTYRVVTDPAGTRFEAVAQNDTTAGQVFAAEEIRAAVATYASADVLSGRRVWR
jgi:hypothetical protein